MIYGEGRIYSYPLDSKAYKIDYHLILTCWWGIIQQIKVIVMKIHFFILRSYFDLDHLYRLLYNYLIILS